MRDKISSLFKEIDSIPDCLNQNHYPSLNGLRGVSILIVVIYHLGVSQNSFYYIIFNGDLGVNIFFVISGFLITTLCIKEKVQTKTISLRDFYVRRILRIFPVAYLYIIVVIILNLIFKLGISYVSVIAAGLYISNFSAFRRHHFDWYLGHFWSLSIEEQFYLMSPISLKLNFKFYLFALLFIVFALPILIFLQSKFPVLNNNILYAFSHYFIKFQAAKQIQRLYELFVKVDSTQIEINPFAETSDGHGNRTFAKN